MSVEELFTARLIEKNCLSEAAQCYHFVFAVEGAESFSFLPGQFVSGVEHDAEGREQTRAYSLASVPRGNRFELCVVRVPEGFFSNHLADLPDLPVGATLRFHGPYGDFTLRQPPTDTILVATGSGVAPVRGILQQLFPTDGPATDKEVWLVFGTRYESDLYFRQEFEALARRHTNFHYLPTLSRADESWAGRRGYVQVHVEQIVRARAEKLGQSLPLATPEPGANFDIHAYICGHANVVAAVREKLKEMGWQRKQIIAEKYD